jgi:hypothetical protein
VCAPGERPRSRLCVSGGKGVALARGTLAISFLAGPFDPGLVVPVTLSSFSKTALEIARCTAGSSAEIVTYNLIYAMLCIHLWI